VQPYGISDPNASYINGDPSQARMGSIPPAEAFEHPMRELVAVISHSNEIPDGGDLEQVSKGVRSQFMNYCEDTGSVNVLSVAINPPLVAYTIGLPLRVKVRNTNTGPATIDAGAGRVSIRLPNGAELAASDIFAGGLAELVYDGTFFQMINFAGASTPSGPPQTFYYNIPYAVDISTTANTVIANFSPAVTSLTAGFICMIKIANTNTGLSNVNVNGLGLTAIYAQGYNATFPFMPGDIAKNDTVVFIYDGTQFWIYPNVAINANSTLNVATISQLNDAFAALGRKRISTTANVTIQLAAAVYNFGATPLITYHADASQIFLTGTMAGGGVPTPNQFYSGGNSDAQRAADSAHNIAMLRARYKTEFRFNNTMVGAFACVFHTGPGMINYQNILITGANVPASASQEINMVGAAVGSAISLVGCTVWGSGLNGYSPNGSFMQTMNCHAANCYGDGFNISANGILSASYGGSYGNAGCGFFASWNAFVWLAPTPLYASDQYGPYATSNASCGVLSWNSTAVANFVTSVGNDMDLEANFMGFLGNYGTLAYTISPPYNEVGNNNSMVQLLA
jgi:hypothetical protein